MNKYRNIKTVVDGILFDSMREVKYYGVLKMRIKAGEIDGFDRQVKYLIEINGIKICTYIADFVTYKEIALKTNKVEVIDVKGFKTGIYKLKNKLMKAVYGIDIIEV